MQSPTLDREFAILNEAAYHDHNQKGQRVAFEPGFSRREEADQRMVTDLLQVLSEEGLTLTRFEAVLRDSDTQEVRYFFSRIARLLWLKACETTTERAADEQVRAYISKYWGFLTADAQETIVSYSLNFSFQFKKAHAPEARESRVAAKEQDGQKEAVFDSDVFSSQPAKSDAQRKLRKQVDHLMELAARDLPTMRRQIEEEIDVIRRPSEADALKKHLEELEPTMWRLRPDADAIKRSRPGWWEERYETRLTQREQRVLDELRKRAKEG